MMLKIFICLAIIIVIFIILNYCFSSQENFDEDYENDEDNETDEKYMVSHTETFDPYNLFDYFLKIHNFEMDLAYNSDRQRLKHLITGGLVDIYFRQLLNINMFYKDQILSGLDEASKSKHSFYMVTNMANFMYYDKMNQIYNQNLDGAKSSLNPDFEDYFIIIKNPILKEINSKRFSNIMEDLPPNIAVIKKFNYETTVDVTPPFNIIGKGSDFEELDNMLVKLNNANYFRNNQDNHLGILYHLVSESNINEIYSYDFNITETPSFLEESPDPNSVINEFKYNWVLQSDNEVVKNVDYFEENSKSGFTLENLDIYDLFMKKYEMYTTISEEKYLINKNKSINCDPETCNPATTNPDCKTRDEVFTYLFSERAKEFPLFHFLSIYTNYITLDNLSGEFLKNQNKKLIPLLINYQEDSRFDTNTISPNNNFYSQMEEKNIFRVLLFYKIFKYDLYDLDQIAKISYLVIIFLFRKLWETNLKNQRLELFQEYRDGATTYRQLSFVFQFETLERANYSKQKLFTIIQNMILRDTENVGNFFPSKESEFNRNFFGCNSSDEIIGKHKVAKEPATEEREAKDREEMNVFKRLRDEFSTNSSRENFSDTNNRDADLVDYSLKLKLYLEDSKLKILTQLENITTQDLYREERIYNEKDTDDLLVVNYSSIKKLTKVENEFKALKNKLDKLLEDNKIKKSKITYTKKNTDILGMG